MDERQLTLMQSLLRRQQHDRRFAPLVNRAKRGTGGGVDEIDPMGMMSKDIAYRPLNFDRLLKSGAIRVTQPGNGRDGGFIDTSDPEDWSLVTKYNDMHGATQGWPDKAASYDSARSAINQPGPMYDGKYNQILWSAQNLGLKDEDIFADPSPGYAKGGAVDRALAIVAQRRLVHR